MSKKKDKFDICFKYYEKAIEARNFHYKNYNTLTHLQKNKKKPF